MNIWLWVPANVCKTQKQYVHLDRNENQTFGVTALFKGWIKHPLNKYNVCYFRSVECNNTSGVEVKNHANWAKHVFNIDVGNVAYPYHVRRFGHEFLLNPVTIDLIFTIGGWRITEAHLLANQIYFLHKPGDMRSADIFPLVVEAWIWFFARRNVLESWQRFPLLKAAVRRQARATSWSGLRNVWW